MTDRRRGFAFFIVFVCLETKKKNREFFAAMCGTEIEIVLLVRGEMKEMKGRKKMKMERKR